MRRRTSLLLALFLVIIGVSGTAIAIQTHRSSSSTHIDGTPAADVADHTITLQNRTDSRIWVGSEVNADGSTAITGLPTLDPGQSATISVPEHEGAGHWRGTFFARQGCTGDEAAARSTAPSATADRMPTTVPWANSPPDSPSSTSTRPIPRHPGTTSATWTPSPRRSPSPRTTSTPPGSGECAVAGCAEDLLSACPAENLTKDPAPAIRWCASTRTGTRRPRTAT